MGGLDDTKFVEGDLSGDDSCFVFFLWRAMNDFFALKFFCAFSLIFGVWSSELGASEVVTIRWIRWSIAQHQYDTSVMHASERAIE